MAEITLPPPVDISNDTKKGVIDGLKSVILVFQEKGLLAKTVTYQSVIHEADVLYDFIQLFKANRALVSHLVVGADGAPVTADNAPLSCGVTLEQIQQLLVKTCARKFFEQERTEETVTETVTRKKFLFFKTTEQVERVNTVMVDERKVRQLLNFMAFDWQLPLLVAYRDDLNVQQLMELDTDFLNLNSVEGIAALGKLEPAAIKKARATTGADFAMLLQNRPSAIVGVAAWNKDWYSLFRNVLGDKCWEFFSREPAYFNVVAALDKPLCRVYGDVLVYASAENLEEMQRLNIDKAGVLIEAMKASLGERGTAACMAVPSFSKDILRKLVESLLHMNQEKDQMRVAAELTCKAMLPQIKEWLVKAKTG